MGGKLWKILAVCLESILTISDSPVWQLPGSPTAYDAAHVDLSELLDAPLLTRDSGVVSVSGHRPAVEMV